MVKNKIREMNSFDIPNIIKYDMAILGETLGEEILLNHLTSGLMKYFVMENSDLDIIGMMSLWIDLDKASINNFYIIDKYQKQGFGREFIDYAIKYLSNIKVKEITLEVRPSNDIAKKLYESFEFHQVSIRKNYYKNGEDALLMYLRIGSD